MSRRGHSGEPASVQIPSPEADELVARAITGDTDAFAELFRSTLHVVFQNIYARCGDHALAEDIASDAFIRALRAIGRFEGSSRDFVAWLLRIARNRFFDHVKSGRIKWELVVDEMPVKLSNLDPAREAVASIEGAELRDALTELTEEQQEVLYLRFLQDLPVAEVASIVGRSEGAVKAMQFRALRTLAKVLERRGADADAWTTD